MLRLLQQHLERVRARMKHQADKKRSEREFQVGDSVFMKLQPYVQSSVAPRAHHKLMFKFYGPFKVLERLVYQPIGFSFLQALAFIQFCTCLSSKKPWGLTARYNHSYHHLMLLLQFHFVCCRDDSGCKDRRPFRKD